MNNLIFFCIGTTYLVVK